MPPRFLNASEAASRLGVSAKALRLYERRGLVTPTRTAAGWRSYGPAEMDRAAKVAALRGLGFSLAQVAQALDGDIGSLETSLAAHQVTLEGRLGHIAGLIGKVRSLRGDLQRPPAKVRSGTGGTRSSALSLAFDLPWPWGGERFELREIRALNYIVGPLGSGKTRFAKRLAKTLPNAAFVGLERSEDSGAAAKARIGADPALRTRVDRSLARLVRRGAAATDALVALLAGLESEGPAVLVIDLVEQGLDQATQQALIAHLRRQGSRGRPLFLMTRSRAILDLEQVGADEAIILCPANHSPPTSVVPRAGAPGYEAVATCLATPEVRARTEGVIAWRPAA